MSNVCPVEAVQKFTVLEAQSARMRFSLLLDIYRFPNHRIIWLGFFLMTSQMAKMKSFTPSPFDITSKHKNRRLNQISMALYYIKEN